MRGDPVDAQQPPGLEVEVQLLLDLAACGGCGWFVGLAHPAGQVPVGLVPGIDEQDAALLVTDEHVGADPLAGLGGVAFGQVRLPRIGVTLVKRHIAGHRRWKITVSEWIERWLAMQDVGVSTVDNREYLIRRFIRPAWGASALNSLGTEEITRWENGLPARTGVSQRTARAARTLLGTILGDAAAAKPSLIPYNPALRPRNRGRKTGRKLERSPQRAWASPLQALLLAERAALLSGRDGDFSMIVTIAYTGLRWGEAIGLERWFHPPERAPRRMATPYRLPPKDDSYRSPKWEPNLP